LTEESQPLAAVWQKWRFRSPQTHLWLIKVWFSASTFVVKIATFAKPQTVSGHSIDDRSTIKQTEKNEKNNQRFSKIKRGAMPPTSRHTIAPHLLLIQRTTTFTNRY
jgi:hypothetical protein